MIYIWCTLDIVHLNVIVVLVLSSIYNPRKQQFRGNFVY